MTFRKSGEINNKWKHVLMSRILVTAHLVIPGVILVTFSAVALPCKPGDTALQEVWPLLDLYVSAEQKQLQHLWPPHQTYQMYLCCIPWLKFAIILLLRNWLVHIAMLFCVFCLILFKDMMQSLAYCKSSHFCMLQTGDVYSACHQRLYMSYIFIHFHLDYLFNQAVGIKGAVCSEETNRERSP